MMNPCLKSSGIKRNKETQRERYVTDAEYNAVYKHASASVQLMMKLCYTTLQRPQSDIINWRASDIQTVGNKKVLVVEQNKTKQKLKITLDGELLQLINKSLSNSGADNPTIVQTLRGMPYTYSGLTKMLYRAIKKAQEEKLTLKTFGFRDLKGKGATDMWLAGIPIERIQALCGHKQKSTTEIYVKARWQEYIEPNRVKIKK